MIIKVFYSACFSSEDRGKLPLLRRLLGGEESFYRGQCGASYSIQHIPQKWSRALQKLPTMALDPPLGPRRASPGSQQEWFRTWS